MLPSFKALPCCACRYYVDSICKHGHNIDHAFESYLCYSQRVVHLPDCCVGFKVRSYRLSSWSDILKKEKQLELFDGL